MRKINNAVKSAVTNVEQFNKNKSQYTTFFYTKSFTTTALQSPDVGYAAH